MGDLEILWQDPTLIAINKPSGLLVHRSEIDRHERRNALQLLRDQVGRRVYPVHRLDKPTSGVLIFTFDADMAREMGNAFTQRRVEKTYLAITRGILPDHCRIDYPLRETLDRYTDSKADPDKAPQRALTQIQRLSAHEVSAPAGRYRTARFSVARINPETGRKHQIRRHLKHIFHPIVGDTTHGDGAQNQFFRAHFGVSRLMLHAHALTFTHPGSGDRIEITAPLPRDMQDVIDFMPPFIRDGTQAPEPPS